MDREVFKELSINEQIEYVNKKLADGESVTKISSYTMPRSTMSSTFKRANYILDKNLNQYIKAGAETEDIESHSIDDNKSHPLKIKDNSLKQDIVLKEDNKKKLYDLLDNYEKIMAFINRCDNGETVCDNKKIFIELPLTNQVDARKTLRINPMIWEDFEHFSNKHNLFTKKDLVSQALKEFMEKYKAESE